MKPCLAFLQNMWVKNPERVRAAIERDGEEFRLTFIEYALFRGCATGRNLKKYFGEALLSQITFEETTREIAGDAKTIFPADAEHIKAALAKHQPRVVLTFGAIAQAAVAPWWNGAYVHSHHPASRHVDSKHSLTRAADELKTILRIKGALAD